MSAELEAKDNLYKLGDNALDRTGQQLMPGVFPQQWTHGHFIDECVFNVVVYLVRRAALTLDVVERCAVNTRSC